MEALGNLLPFALILALMYLLLIRPARKQQQKVSATQSRVAVGTRVRTGSGIYATVVSIDDANVDLEIAPGVVVTFLRAAITHVLESKAETETEADIQADAEGEHLRSEGLREAAPADHRDGAAEPGPSTDSPNADRPAV